LSSQRKYRVLHLITRLELGGAQQNTLFCVEHHDRSLFEVELIAGRGGALDDVASRIPQSTVSLVPWLRHAIRPWSDLRALFRLRSYFKQREIDLVHTHSSKAGMLGRCAALLAGVPVVVHTVHGWSFNDTQPGWLRRGYVRLEKMMASVSDRLIVVAEPNRTTGLELGIGREAQYRIVHSGIDVEAFRGAAATRGATRRSLGYDDDHVVVGGIACLKPQKAPLDFIRAAARACAADSRLRFFLAGDGKLRPEVEREIQELGVEDRVQLLGWRSDVVELFGAMDLFLLTSRFEGLPRVVLQAMAARVPVIATAVDGTPEVVEDGQSGLLIPPGSPDIAAERVVALAGDVELSRRLVACAAQRLTREFEIHSMLGELEHLYVSLLDSASDEAAFSAAAG